MTNSILHEISENEPNAVKIFENDIWGSMLTDTGSCQAVMAAGQTLHLMGQSFTDLLTSYGRVPEFVNDLNDVDQRSLFALLQYGFPINLDGRPIYDFNTKNVNRKVIETLYEAKIDLDLPLSHHASLLDFAVEAQDYSLVLCLLRARATVQGPETDRAHAEMIHSPSTVSFSILKILLVYGGSITAKTEMDEEILDSVGLITPTFSARRYTSSVTLYDRVTTHAICAKPLSNDLSHLPAASLPSWEYAVSLEQSMISDQQTDGYMNYKAMIGSEPVYNPALPKFYTENSYSSFFVEMDTIYEDEDEDDFTVMISESRMPQTVTPGLVSVNPSLTPSITPRIPSALSTLSSGSKVRRESVRASSMSRIL